jgi:hypothetical protein
MSANLKFEVINDGKVLRVSAENPVDFAQFIKDNEEEALTSYTPNSDIAFMQLTESYCANGWGVYTADTLGQMSECLVISKDSTIEDDGSITLNGKAWANINDYQIVSPLDIILNDGYYDFQLWDEFENENFKVNDLAE